MNIENTPAGTVTPADLFLGRLRTQTNPAHKALENLAVSTAILSPKVNVESYAHYLTLMHDVISDTEKNIFPVLNHIIPDLSSRAKRESLEADLQHLGFAKSSFKAVFGD